MAQQNKTIVLETRHFLFGALIIGLVVGFVLLGRAPTDDQSNEITGKVVQNMENAQIVQVSMVGNEYIFKPAIVTKDIPVRLEVDMNSVRGCYRSMVIPTLDVRKLVSEQDNIVEFIPTTTGVMTVSCSMGMGSGSFTVE